MRTPENDTIERFDQLIRCKHFAFVVNHKCRQAKRGECRASSARPFKLQTRGHKGAAGDMRAQRIKLLNGVGLHRSERSLSFKTNEYTVLRRQNEYRRCGVTETARINYITIKRIGPQFLVGENVY